MNLSQRQRWAAVAVAVGIVVGWWYVTSRTDTKESCYADASRRSTDAGVRLAESQCYEKYKGQNP